MAYSQLRELARHFAGGRLAREEYLSRRAALIEDMVDGKVQVDYRDFVSAPTAATPPLPLIDVGDDEVEVRRAPVILAGIALVAALGAGSFWYLRLQTAPPPAVQAAAPVAESVTLVTAFLRTGDWSPEATEAFRGAWLALAEDERLAARADKVWKRFAFALDSKIGDQAALVPVDETGQAAAEEARLRAFAADVGVEVD